MNWNELNEDSEWLFRQLARSDEKAERDEKTEQLEQLVRKLKEPGVLRKKIREQEEFDYLTAYRRLIGRRDAVGGTAQVKRRVATREKRHSKGLRRKAWNVAAGILLIIGAGTAIFHTAHEHATEQQEELMLAGILPGSPKAVLTTSDGVTRELGGAPAVIREGDGHAILADSSGIHYEGANKQTESATVYHTLTVPRGGEYFITLSDSTCVWLNADSKLKYPVHFAGKTREVTVSGEAYFQVKKQNGQPFVVHTRHGSITVLGTEFNIRSYPDNPQSVTTLVNGKIRYRHHVGGQEAVLAPCQQLVTDSRGIESLSDTDPRYACGWKSGAFLFRNKSLEEIMQQLERWYDIHVFYTNPEVKELHFSGDLSRFRHIGTFIEMLEESSKVKIKVRDRNLIIGWGK